MLASAPAVVAERRITSCQPYPEPRRLIASIDSAVTLLQGGRWSRPSRR